MSIMKIFKSIMVIIITIISAVSCNSNFTTIHNKEKINDLVENPLFVYDFNSKQTDRELLNDYKIFDLQALLYFKGTKLNMSNFSTNYSNSALTVTLKKGKYIEDGEYDLYLFANRGSSISDPNSFYPEEVILNDLVYSDNLFTVNSDGTLNVGERESATGSKISGIPACKKIILKATKVGNTSNVHLLRTISKISIKIDGATTPDELKNYNVTIKNIVDRVNVFSAGIIIPENALYTNSTSYTTVGILSDKINKTEDVAYIQASDRAVEVKVTFGNKEATTSFIPVANKNHVLKVTSGAKKSINKFDKNISSNDNKLFIELETY